MLPMPEINNMKKVVPFQKLVVCTKLYTHVFIALGKMFNDKHNSQHVLDITSSF
jgi:hypothetical protein